MKLSICIPTYNRADYLSNTLEKVVAQIRASEHHDVEIIVADNGSTDDTVKIVNQIISSNPDLPIKLLAHQNNFGFDRNVLSVVAAARGEYCWLMGDDDTLYADSIIKLKKLFVEHSECSHFHINYSKFDKSLDKVTINRMIAISKNQVFTNANEFYFYPLSRKSYFRLLGTNVITMSTNIFKRHLWNEQLDDVERFIRHNMIHVFILTKMAVKQPGICFVAEPLVEYLCMNHRIWDNDIWAEYRQFVYDHMEQLGYSKLSLTNARKLEISYRPLDVQFWYIFHPIQVLKAMVKKCIRILS